MRRRRFEDERGEVWEAWELPPAAIERRIGGDRRVSSAEPPWFERRCPTDRRVRNDPRPLVADGAEHGGLAFEAERRGERRRLDALPPDWGDADDARLRELLRSAHVLPRVVLPGAALVRRPGH